ncbi:aldehyde dehydrogenase family protein [Pseudobacteriovorax antillogorgiicola]|uniref:Succinate semialdehyde dehydrogenase n=1 Tax=Pseudobacteriovorax antillogorgiicola TaxID=1513793 RepID=A0A1Y6CNB4_9BACT|nr:aldehyde dehydrogenase family protein [Pseudobacteriovorax antillogorgiicola]TCS47238.1 succinate-semialdehyde dehydrogenase/glutarate-semialdehyde dehydrogenase [Pseudobacteriovorax antillogorgiicola]SMF61971.1 succinate semialdehyde dehydrogenase [Pseudobacteriovorax antillogorgiicola]
MEAIQHVKLLIHGEWQSSSGTFAVKNPYDQTTLAHVADGTAADATAAVDAAAQAFGRWKKSAPEERRGILLAWADLIKDRKDALANLLCREQGKVLWQAEAEILHGASLVERAAEESVRIHGMTLARHDDQVRNFILKQAVGVVAAITPWNFPAASVLVKCASAIAAGCTVVLKPSEETPLLALELAALAMEANLPPGVLNVIPCLNPTAVGQVLTNDPRVSLLSFTGSSAVGKGLAASCAPTLKRLSLELGGNAPFLVFDDADIDAACDAAMGARFFNSGQICVGANRFLVHQSVEQAFVDGMVARAKKLVAGNGLEQGVGLGPLINDKAVSNLNRLVEDAVAQGAQLHLGGVGNGEGLCYQATILSQVTQNMAVAGDEVFGPVVCIYRFQSDEEAIAMANNTRAGLAGYVFTGNQKRLWSVAEELECGMVGANTSNIFAPELAFGGLKESGMGREGGLDCLSDYLILKNLSLGL